MNISFIQKLLIILSSAILINSKCLANQDLEYKVKALYIIRLASFITWPENADKEKFIVCIKPTDPISNWLKASDINEVKGLPLEIIDFTHDISVSKCNFLYLSEEYVNPAIATEPIVTVSSQPNFAKQGGMVEFYIDKTKVRMKANLKAINKSGVIFSDALIKLLRIVN